ncbi:MAG: thiolase family protein [Planctomycetota bacterium]|jgi:acetyl-CoA C-acetyltransferase|nr:thiolase family protein [Planctomycetota bacterium]
MASSPIVIASAVRTPIGRFNGSFSQTPATDLGATAVSAALAQAGLEPNAVEQVIFGMGRQAGAKPNPARQVQFGAGIPQEATAWTVNMACASGMKTIALAADEIRLGRAKVVVAGGMENMSRVPFMLDRMRDGYRLGDAPVIDGMYHDGFRCPLSNMIMGETAELLAQERGISREQQDAFAKHSQDKANTAWDAGHFQSEIVPVTLKTRKGETVMDRDEHMRVSTTMEGLAKLPAVFAKENGTVSPGNASGITDGAAALVVMSADEAEKRGIEPLAELLDYQQAGTDPKRMGLGPVPATNALFERNNWSLEDFGLFELNEAFAAQVLACLQELPIPEELLNVNGGAISLGHPIGCTGARIVVTLLHEMRRRKVERGLATLCVSGGLGITSAFKLV